LLNLFAAHEVGEVLFYLEVILLLFTPRHLAERLISLATSARGSGRLKIYQGSGFLFAELVSLDPLILTPKVLCTQLLLDVREVLYVTRLLVLDVIVSSSTVSSEKSSPTLRCSRISLPALGSSKPRAPLKQLKTPTTE